MPPKRRVPELESTDDDDDIVPLPRAPRRSTRGARSSSIASVTHVPASASSSAAPTRARASTGREGTASTSKGAASKTGTIPQSSFYGSSSTKDRNTRRSTSVHSSRHSRHSLRSTRKSAGTSAEPLFLTGSDLELDADDDNAAAATGLDSTTEASPPGGRPTPPEYEYIDASEGEMDAGPSRGRPYVDMVFKGLAHLAQYTYGSDEPLRRPSESTRAWLLETQRMRPRSPRRIQAPRSSKPQQPQVYVVDDDDDDDFEISPQQEELEDEEDEADVESEDDEVVVQPRRTRQMAREQSSSPEMVSTRAQAKAAAAPKRKRRRSSSRESNASYNPYANGRVEESEGESEIDEIAEWSDYSEGTRSPVKRSRMTPNLLKKHREFCERCQLGPADDLLAKAIRKKKKGKRGRKRKNEDEEGLISEEEEARMKEGWLECDRCVTSSHWGCLNDEAQRIVLNDYRVRYPKEPRRKSIAIDETATYTCARCLDYPVCFVCKKEHISEGGDHNSKSADAAQGKDKDESGSKSKSPEKSASTAREGQPDGSQHEPITIDSDNESADPLDLLRSDRESSPDAPNNHRRGKGKGKLVDQHLATPILFRCFRCKQAVHYEHLRNPFHGDNDYTLPALAAEYQSNLEGTSWYCHCCRDWKWLVDKIIAWRPLPENAVEPEREPGELPRYKDRLPREYLIKFRDRSFRHLPWVPHEWLQVVAPQKLKNFLEKGPQLDLVTDATLAARGDQIIAPTIMDVVDLSDDGHHRHLGEVAELDAIWEGHGPPPDAYMENNVPKEWSTADRLLDVYLLPPKGQKKVSQVSRNRVMSSESEGESEPELEDGVQPPQDYMIEMNRWENMAGRRLTADDVDEIAPLVTWFLAKWQDLQYDQACFDTPPSRDDPVRWPAFKRALARYLTSRRVVIPVLGARACNERDSRAARLALEDPPSEQPDCVTGGELMPFQLEGFQWLLYKHWSREGCILADDMGLGKTIQVCSFLGYLCSEEHKTYPHLVIVPNSTITNWVREFEKWVPHVRVVPYYGEAASRKVINNYELFHMGKQGKAEGLKAHVVLSTYDTVTGAEFRIFNNIPRWETVVVDEGQRLKSDSSLMFNKLKKLNAIHRVLLTGTPLNNNLRELFNLLNFIDPDNFTDLAALEERFEALNESLVQELHNMIKPYILRRIKSQVLKLPPKVEIIVPTSMTPAQKRLTKIILTRSAEMLGNIRKKRKQLAAAKKRKAVEAIDVEEAAEVDGLIKSGEPSKAPSKSRSPEKAANDNGHTEKGKGTSVEKGVGEELEVVEVDDSEAGDGEQRDGDDSDAAAAGDKARERDAETETDAEIAVDEGLGAVQSSSSPAQGALHAVTDDLTVD